MNRLRSTLLAAAALLLASTSAAEPPRFGLLVGHNRGDPDEANLAFAEDDAEKLYGVLSGLGGFPDAHLTLIRGGDAERVRRALVDLNDRIRAHPEGGQALLLVYYSGHADARQLHLGGTHLALDELEKLVRGSAAGFRLLIVDACRSGALTRVKGGSPVVPAELGVRARTPGEGVVFLSSSSATEDAQESVELKGSFFTHYLVSGLLGPADRDGDGDVTLDESYRYAYDHTVRATSRSFSGVQHPTFRFELKGRHAIALTRPSQRYRASLSFPQGAAWLIFAGGPGGAVVAEVGALDLERTVSLRPGEYYVRGRGREHLLEGRLSLLPGERRALDSGGLQRVEYARLVRKGGTSLTSVHGAQAGYRMRSALEGEGLCHGWLAGHALELSELTLTSRLVGCHGSFDNATLSATTLELGLEVGVARAVDLPWLTLSFGGTLGLSWLRQSFDLETEPARDSAAGRLAAIVGLSRDLPGGLYLFAELSAGLYVLERRRSELDAAELSTRFAGGVALGLGLRL